MKTKKSRFFAFFALLCASCSFLIKDTRITTCCPQKGPILEVATINAGLAPGIVPYATPRAKPFAYEIAKYRGAGILCLQEVWREDYAQEILKALNLPPENVFRVDTRGLGEEKNTAFCSQNELGGVRSCVEKHCKNVPGEEISNCAMVSCFTNLAALYVFSRRCVHCLVASAGRPLGAIIDTCVNQGGATKVYEGANGVILASRWPLHDRTYVNLPASAANRVALFARVDIAGSESLEVACTHISSSSSYIPPINSGFSTWSQEMKAQIKMIANLLFARAGNGPSLLVGDVNSGPAVGNSVDSASLAVWGLIKRLGFRSPAVETSPPFCTMCSDNNLRNSPHADNRSGSSSHNIIIDHVLAHDPPGGTTLEPVCAHPMMDEPQWILGYNGEPIYTNLSDHYGLVVKFFLRNSSPKE